MKEDTLDALPGKFVHPIETVMPSVQANAYTQVVKEAAGCKESMMLEVLHRLRSISLHPFINQASASYSVEAYINASARLMTTIEILDKIKAKHDESLGGWAVHKNLPGM